MSNWKDTINQMGVESNGSFFSLPKSGADPIVVIYNGHNVVDCTAQEKEERQSADGRTYSFCRPNGKTTEYEFTSVIDGSTQILRSISVAFLIACDEYDVQPGETLKIWCTGSGKNTRFHIERVSDADVEKWRQEYVIKTAEANAMERPHTPSPKQAEVSQADVDAAATTPDINDIPF